MAVCPRCLESWTWNLFNGIIMVFVSVTDFLVLHIINNAHYFLVNLYSSTVCTHRKDFILRNFIISVATFSGQTVFCSGNAQVKQTYFIRPTYVCETRGRGDGKISGFGEQVLCLPLFANTVLCINFWFVNNAFHRTPSTTPVCLPSLLPLKSLKGNNLQPLWDACLWILLHLANYDSFHFGSHSWQGSTV